MRLEKHFLSALFKSLCEVMKSCLGSENLTVLLATHVEQACGIREKGECLRETVKGFTRVKEINHRLKRKNNSLHVEEFYACVQVVFNLHLDLLWEYVVTQQILK